MIRLMGMPALLTIPQDKLSFTPTSACASGRSGASCRYSQPDAARDRHGSQSPFDALDRMQLRFWLLLQSHADRRHVFLVDSFGRFWSISLEYAGRAHLPHVVPYRAGTRTPSKMPHDALNETLAADSL
eukprot:6210000-Pleurochrysis_carterae.AAC.2